MSHTANAGTTAPWPFGQRSFLSVPLILLCSFLFMRVIESTVHANQIGP